jgi:hypothetical protein
MGERLRRAARGLAARGIASLKPTAPRQDGPGAVVSIGCRCACEISADDLRVCKVRRSDRVVDLGSRTGIHDLGGIGGSPGLLEEIEQRAITLSSVSGGAPFGGAGLFHSHQTFFQGILGLVRKNRCLTDSDSGAAFEYQRRRATVSIDDELLQGRDNALNA